MNNLTLKNTEIPLNPPSLHLDKKELEPGNINFFVTEEDEPILKLCGTGDIFVKGKLIENDIEVVEALRAFIENASKTHND